MQLPDRRRGVSYDDASQHGHTPARPAPRPAAAPWLVPAPQPRARRCDRVPDRRVRRRRAQQRRPHALAPAARPRRAVRLDRARVALRLLHPGRAADGAQHCRRRPGLVLLAAATTWAGQLADAALGVKAPPVEQARRLLRRARGAGDDDARVRAHGRPPLGHADRAHACRRHRPHRAPRRGEARRAARVRHPRRRLRRRRPAHRPHRRRPVPRPDRRDRAPRRASTACTA